MALVFSGHALKRMIIRNIDPQTVASIIAAGTCIAEYRDDKPFPSRLLSGWDGNRPIHVVAATDIENDLEYIITVYEPETGKWDESFTKRRTL
ncbi:MAG: hypothetical protein A2Y38_00620 [Spirochaetes bacterium GWB1_59_5]|nr:MAG: hypothetical protein A2Y38_00620 [Spirochaetes bacterium GWB1_59_5]